MNMYIAYVDGKAIIIIIVIFVIVIFIVVIIIIIIIIMIIIIGIWNVISWVLWWKLCLHT